jgi:hypothetical protein
MEYILLSLLLLSLYINYIFYKKNDKCLKLLSYQDNFLIFMFGKIKETSKKLNEIDQKGTFKTDDEVGFFFDYLKEMQEELKKYDIK